MGKGTKQKKYLNVAVYYGGAELGRYCHILSSSRGVTAGRGILCDIKSVIWPRWDNLEIILKTKAGLVLNPNLPWDGVISDNQGFYALNSQKRGKQLYEISSSTTASLRLESMSVAIKVGPKDKRRDLPARTLPGYIASPLRFIADKPAEWGALGAAFVGAAIIALSANSTLLTRGNDTYTGVEQLPDSNLLPFLSHKHLATAPNVLQSHLDRFNYVHNVWNYYTDLATVIGFGEKPGEKSAIFSTTVADYAALAREQTSTIAAAETHQKRSLSKTAPGHSITIPMVRGESLSARVMRVLDKVDIVATSADELVKRRNVVAEEFAKDIGFKYDSHVPENKVNESFAKISSGFLGLESDDKMQARQAEMAAASAALLQLELFGKDRLRFGAVNCCSSPAGAALTQEGVVWIAPDYSLNDTYALSAVKASTWGAPVKEAPKIKEPRGGHLEPDAIERTVSAGRYQLRLCYELALRRNHAASGSMEWRWHIDTRGQISSIDLLKSSIKDDELIRCVHDKIATWRFPRPRGGSVEVRYPFEFSRDKG